MLRTMQALIQPKLVHRDLPLFAALLSDLFPGLEAPPPAADALRQAIELELRATNLQVIQLAVSTRTCGLIADGFCCSWPLLMM